MTKIITIAAAFLLIISACNNNSKKMEKSIYDAKTIDASDLEPLDTKNLVNPAKYILLENTELSAFSEIDKAKFLNDKIYILDVSGLYYVYIFNKDGKFLKRIGNRGKGVGKYLRLCDFDVDKQGNIYLYDRQKMKLLMYDSNGSFLKEWKVPFRAESFNLLNDKQYIFSLAKAAQNKDLDGVKVVVTDTSFTVAKMFFNYDDAFQDDKANVGLFTESPKGFLYNKAVNDTLFLFDKSGKVTNSYKVDFGKYAVPENLRNAYNEVISERSAKHFNYFFCLPFIVGDYLFGNILYGSDKALFIYDFKQNKAYANEITMKTFSHKDINFPIGVIGDSTLVTYINVEQLAADKDKSSLDANVKKHVENGGVVLKLHTLKK